MPRRGSRRHEGAFFHRYCSSHRKPDASWTRRSEKESFTPGETGCSIESKRKPPLSRRPKQPAIFDRWRFPSGAHGATNDDMEEFLFFVARLARKRMMCLSRAWLPHRTQPPSKRRKNSFRNIVPSLLQRMADENEVVSHSPRALLNS